MQKTTALQYNLTFSQPHYRESVTAMYHVEISEEDRTKINKLRDNHPNKMVRKRLSVLHFKSLHFTHKAIQVVVECSSKLVTSALKMYQKGGLSEVLEVRRHIRVSELEVYRDLILEKFRECPPATAKQASIMLYEITKIKRGLTQTKKFLHKIGLKPRMTAAMPAKVDPVQQEDFKKKSWSLS